MNEELIKRLGALAFAAVYTAKHGNTRAGALRVASHAYKFLNGEDVTSINEEADAADTLREARAKPSRQKFSAKVQFSKLRRLTKYGHRSNPHRAAGG